MHNFAGVVLIRVRSFRQYQKQNEVRSCCNALSDINSRCCEPRSKSSENVREELKVDYAAGRMFDCRINDGGSLKEWKNIVLQMKCELQSSVKKES